MEIIDVINARTSVRRYKKSSSVGEDIIQNLVALAECELHRLKIVSPGRLFM